MKYNKLSFKVASCFTAIMLTATGSALAAATPEEVARLGADLTPIGAEKAGNAAGTIPAWSGGLTTAPAGFVDANTGHVNPYKDEKPLFVIDASNVEQYKDQLTAGHLAMFKKYPTTYKMSVYPSHRSAAYPQKVYDDTKKFAGSTTLVDGGNGVTDSGTSTVPFPFPKSGQEIMWNHTFRWKGGNSHRVYDGMPVQPNGNFYKVRWDEEWYSPLQGGVENAKKDMLNYILITAKEPATLAGTMFLVHDDINQVANPRKAWIYNAGQRRVRRAPELGYDFSPDGTDALRCADQYDGWVGATDRYDWKIVGKKEVYIPYNSYDMADKSLSYDQILKPGHLNQEYARYELHRVWVVEANLKDGERHIFGKRTYYIDEDTWSVSVADNYDTRGDLWRVEENHLMNFYDSALTWTVGSPQYDLNSGAYIHFYALNEVKEAIKFGIEGDAKKLQPRQLKRRGF